MRKIGKYSFFLGLTVLVITVCAFYAYLLRVDFENQPGPTRTYTERVRMPNGEWATATTKVTPSRGTKKLPKWSDNPFWLLAPKIGGGMMTFGVVCWVASWLLAKVQEEKLPKDTFDSVDDFK